MTYELDSCTMSINACEGMFVVISVLCFGIFSTTYLILIILLSMPCLLYFRHYYVYGFTGFENRGGRLLKRLHNCTDLGLEMVRFTHTLTTLPVSVTMLDCREPYVVSGTHGWGK
ncbi:unnamed protein product, partial [Sphacelaria rigidula]